MQYIYNIYIYIYVTPGSAIAQKNHSYTKCTDKKRERKKKRFMTNDLQWGIN